MLLDPRLRGNDKFVRLLRRPSTGSLAMTDNKEMDSCLRRNDERGNGLRIKPAMTNGRLLHR